MRLAVVLTCLVVALLCAPARAGTSPLDAALAHARLAVAAPAATATTMACGRVAWSGASGVYALGSHRAVTPRTRFILTSATKTVTAAMVMQQVQAGRLSLQTVRRPPLARPRW
jgi:CubicO group peptidase (beta-lactamase class C family)